MANNPYEKERNRIDCSTSIRILKVLFSLMNTQNPLENWADSSIETLLGARSSVNKLKVNLWAGAIRERISILNRSLEQLLEEELVLDNRIIQLGGRPYDTEQTYQMLKNSLQGLQTRRISEEKECWKDIVVVLRDFIGAFEAHSQSQARGEFLGVHGRTTQKYVQ
ncbi:hypothetical protein G0Q06_12950 [Puniceicoccales bacterium CK1056]|uniref:Uncharacterized protein n=1 Tax=Oceanipulchritudo coccoides TaxID=2706888 RepID=A0A6B2M4T6_9BACT|nr:hypothetical protein [Oceanipulchritudo coccoides]NDV63366.1 hypothetical protein [Oceanipulchritudo coccoides]